MQTLTVFTPAYNRAHTIGRTYKSLCSQKCKDFVWLIVDDGSTDNTLELCNEYSNKDLRIFVFTQENKGPASARNFGLNNARGKYILFLDSDDDLSENIVFELVNEMSSKKVDFVCCGYFEGDILKKGNLTIKNTKCYTGDVRGFLHNIDQLLTSGILQAPWAKLYKKDLISYYKILFPENMVYGEDTIFVYEYLSRVNNASMLEKPLYYHLIYQGSLSNRLVNNITDINIQLYTKLLNLLKRWDIPKKEEKISKHFINSIIYGTNTFFKNEYRLSKIERKKQINKILDDDFVKEFIFKYPLKTVHFKIFQWSFRWKNPNFIIIFMTIKENMRYVHKIIRRGAEVD